MPQERDIEKEFLALLELFIQCVEQGKGKKLDKDTTWLADAQTLATKLFFHLASLYHLAQGTSLPKLAGIPIGFTDSPSMIVLARTAFETYLAFSYLFVTPKDPAEREFRHRVWKLGGMLDRQKFFVVTQMGKAKKDEERPVVDGLRNQVESHTLYSKLSSVQRKRASRGEWRLDLSWSDLAEQAGFHRDYFAGMYRYMCSYGHAGGLSTLQISQSKEADKKRMGQTWLGLSLTITAHFIQAYGSIVPEAQAALRSNASAAELATMYAAFGRDDPSTIIRA